MPADGLLPPHRVRIEVRFREVDAYGVAWHGHYVDWLEVARHRFAAHFDFDTEAFLARGIRLPMLELALDFRQALRFGDLVEVEVLPAPDPRKVLAFRYRLTRVADGRLVATARTAQVVQGADGRLLLGWPADLAALVAGMRAYGAGTASGSETLKRVP